MKTLKALKITSILNGIFCLSFIISIICFAVNQYYKTNLLSLIGALFVYGWMVNPIPFISCIRCFILYLTERKSEIDRQTIGRKWIWIFVWPVITTAIWVFGGGLFVIIIGGV
jgi:hypothetical protein